ncbi:MAG: class I SAM-dependent methyltransferase [Thermoplasmata archaeon]
MGLPAAAKAFDDLSDVYDETRSPPDPATIAKVIEVLRSAGVARMLEVGVGTGRMARPLIEAGLPLVGIDAARGMLEKARTKGIRGLVQGSAHRLPFPDRAFDGALFVHVLHVLERPEVALREAGRVSRVGAFALLHPTAPDERPLAPEENPIRMLIVDLTAHGWPVSDRPRAPGRREAELLAAHPPDATATISDAQVTEPVGQRLELVARRASRHFLDVPPDLLAAAVARVRARIGDRTRTYRRRELLVRWDAAPLAREPPVPARDHLEKRRSITYGSTPPAE